MSITVTIHTLLAGSDITTDTERDDVTVFVVENVHTGRFIHASLTHSAAEQWAHCLGATIIPIDQAYEYATKPRWVRKEVP